MLGTLKRAMRIVQEPRRDTPIYICCHHKVGTKLMRKVFKNICAEFGWRIGTSGGKSPTRPDGFDVILFNHSQVDLASVEHPFVAVHILRDPRDVIVSGYLYHKRCSEPWCINTTFDYTHPIKYPIVPRSQEHRSEAWKVNYLDSLGGLSYQENLRRLSQDDGLLFEMERYGRWTTEEMLRWKGSPNVALEVRFEDIMQDFEGTFKDIFTYIGLSSKQVESSVVIASAEDINRMSDKEIELNKHISSRNTSKWMGYFTQEHKDAFVLQFGDALQRLGYETTSEW